MRRIHFLSGLPRSGSTLLAAILSQNPRFSAGMSGPVAGLFASLLEGMSAKNEFSVFITDAQRSRILRGLFESYYAEHEAEVVFDTNRSWCARLPALVELFPESRLIACVRDVSWIMDSFERLIRRNRFQPSLIFGYQAGGTVYTRVNGLAGSDGLVGYAYDALKEAFYGEHADRLLVVQYESLVGDPERVLRKVYEFLGEPYFAHDFERVEFDARRYDEKAGTPGLHTVRRRVGKEERESILPPDLFQRFSQDAFWKEPQNNPRGVVVV